MKKYLNFLFCFFALFINISCSKAEDKFPVDAIDESLVQDSNLKLIVFMPSLSTDTEYAPMIVQAFKKYFVDKLAFKEENRDDMIIDVILVSNREKQEESNNEFRLKPFDGTLYELLVEDGIHYYYNIADSLKLQLNLPELNDLNASSILYLVDKENNIIFKDEEYRGQGEHLKPVEYKIKEYFNVEYPRINNHDQSKRNVGDTIPDHILVKLNSLSLRKSSIKVLTFYPAPYSGLFELSLLKSNLSYEKITAMSCAAQISLIDRMIKNDNRVSYIALSESTPDILKKWKYALGTSRIEYLNDSDYTLSTYFGDYNKNGYNNRLSVIIDQNNRIVYIDESYSIEKNEEL